MERGDIYANRYRLEKPLGHGGFSSVWLAFDIVSKVDVALKIYAPDGYLDDECIEDFREEFRLVFDLNHSNILRPYHYGVLNKKPFIVLPFCTQGSCLSKKGKFTDEELWKLLSDVSSGLSYLHNNSKRIIHQDIKPDNILIDNSGHYLITDFGISVKMHHTIRRTVVNHYDNVAKAGTIAYMGPERFGEDPTPLMASDIWSLGATVYELVEGHPPFGENGGGMQAHAVIPKIKANISKDIAKLIYACLSFNPWDRPTADDIKKCAVSRRFISKKPKYRLGLPAAVVATLAILCSVGGYVYYKDIDTKRNKAIYGAYINDGDSNLEHVIYLAGENIFEVDSIRNSLAESHQNYRSAIEMDLADEDERNVLIDKIGAIENIMLSCDHYQGLTDTIRQYYEDERMVSAKAYEEKQKEHRSRIINQIKSIQK